MLQTVHKSVPLYIVHVKSQGIHPLAKKVEAICNYPQLCTYCAKNINFYCTTIFFPIAPWASTLSDLSVPRQNTKAVRWIETATKAFNVIKEHSLMLHFLPTQNQILQLMSQWTPWTLLLELSCSNTLRTNGTQSHSFLHLHWTFHSQTGIIDITAETVARALVSGWISRSGILITDQGKQFESTLCILYAPKLSNCAIPKFLPIMLWYPSIMLQYSQLWSKTNFIQHSTLTIQTYRWWYTPKWILQCSALIILEYPMTLWHNIPLSSCVAYHWKYSIEMRIPSQLLRRVEQGVLF